MKRLSPRSRQTPSKSWNLLRTNKRLQAQDQIYPTPAKETPLILPQTFLIILFSVTPKALVFLKDLKALKACRVYWRVEFRLWSLICSAGFDIDAAVVGGDSKFDATSIIHDKLAARQDHAGGLQLPATLRHPGIVTSIIISDTSDRPTGRRLEVPEISQLVSQRMTHSELVTEANINIIDNQSRGIDVSDAPVCSWHYVICHVLCPYSFVTL